MEQSKYQRVRTSEKYDFRKKHAGLSPIQQRCFDEDEKKLSFHQAVDLFMWEMVLTALMKADGNRAKAARFLRINRLTLVEYLARAKGERPKKRIRRKLADQTE
jgi:DNA-binding NtrC family response regulator